MKYIRLFEQFEEGHKFDILDLYLMDLEEVKELFCKELDKMNPDMENIQVFLDSGLVGVHTKDGYGWTPLHLAAANNSLEVSELLISSGAEVNAKNNVGRTPLHWAAIRGNRKMQELLISHGGTE